MSTIVLGPACLELRLAQSDHGLSARRLWEHTELGQINVFNQTISAHRELNDPAAFIDVVWFDGETFSLAGSTLADLGAGRIPADSVLQEDTVLLGLTKAQNGAAFVRAVANHLDRCSIRQATRNQHYRFLPSAQVDDVFGVALIFSTLQRRLQSMEKAKADTEQWIRTIENFQKKGLRAEELERSNLMPELVALDDAGEQMSAVELANLCDFSALRLSVIPVVNDAQQQLRFTAPTTRKLTRTKNLPKALAALPRSLARFDPVLGYRIEQVEHQTLLGAGAQLAGGNLRRQSDPQCLEAFWFSDRRRRGGTGCQPCQAELSQACGAGTL